MGRQRCITVSKDGDGYRLNDRMMHISNILFPPEHIILGMRSFCEPPNGRIFVFSAERTEDNRAKKCVLDI